ncbi:8-oxoguanine DNA glycosylase OGG fold protein [Streptomyces phaeochromogenes]
MGRQDLADELDDEFRKLLLPPTAVHALGLWLAGSGAQYVTGAGGHAVGYVPAHWSGVEPWPVEFPERSGTGTVRISRDQVVASTRRAAERSAWPEALVASYVWGQGRTGYGPHRLKEILAEPTVDDALSMAGSVLREEGAVAAYRGLRGAVKGLGPAFFTKFLHFLDQAYFLDQATDASAVPRALILDQRVARVMRAHAAWVGADVGLASASEVAAWIWSDSGWTSHRYEVYLGWVHSAAGQLASAGIGWPGSRPDVLELALFDGVWNPAS